MKRKRKPPTITRVSSCLLLTMEETHSILFLCLGNIVRSTMSEIGTANEAHQMHQIPTKPRLPSILLFFRV